jgi:hypothetical protein
MLEVVNRQLDTKVVPGEVFTGGTSREETLEGIDILSEATRVAERANHDFDVTGVIANSRLELRGNWYEKKGVKTTLLLAEGRNLVDPDGDLLTEDGEEIANRIIGFPNSGTAASSKPVILSDDASAQQHGPRYFGEAYSDVSEQDTLLKHCQELLKKKKSPNRLIGCTVLDQGATFEQIRVGNQSLVELYTAGLTAGKLGTSLMGRTLGRRYTDRTKRYELALEEVLE